MRRRATFQVPVSTPFGPLYLGSEPDGPLVELAQAATFELWAAPTGLQRLQIRDVSYQIAGASAGDPRKGMAEVASLQGRIDAIDRQIAQAAMAAVRGSRAPQEVPAKELETWFARPPEEWDDARRAVVGLEAQRAEVASILDEIDFLARWEVLAVSVPPGYAKLREAPLEPVRAQALQAAYYGACAAYQQDPAGKAPPSGS